ncbi:MAG: SPASM domain-containing protein [Tissierellia bacterium]|nr:SPASM domain-containing protein [Tissierellia bacterium]
MKEKYSDYIFCENPKIIFNLGNECDPYGGCKYTEENSLYRSDQIDKFYKVFKKVFDQGIPVNRILPASSCIKDNKKEFVLGPSGTIYNCISGLGNKEFIITNGESLYDDLNNSLSQLICKKGSQKEAFCQNCHYYSICNGGCYYDKINQNKKTSCPKDIFNRSIDHLMDLIYHAEEIGSGIYRKGKNLPCTNN